MIRRIGITMPDILLLAVLLGILAAIIIPHISGVGPRSRSLTLARDLRRMRSSIERYKRDHNDELSAKKGDTFHDFMRKITKKTDSDGCPGYEFGPYLQRLPVNSFNNLRTVRIDGAAAGTNIAGWRFDTLTGTFQADDSPKHAVF